MEYPMSYLEFKLSLEMAYVSTFERDPWVQEPILRINKQ